MTSTRITQDTAQKNYIYEPNENTLTSVNVGQPERWLSAIGGGALASYGILRRDWLGAALATIGGALLIRGATGHSFLYQAFDIVTVEQSPSTLSNIPGNRGVRIQRRMTIERPAAELYAFWRDVEKAPLYMQGITQVQQTGDRTSHWTARVPGGKTMEWNSELLEDVPGKLISWHAHGNAFTGSAGRVSFEPAAGGRGTVVMLELDFQQLKGPLGTSLGKILGHVPEGMAHENLRRFKELMEAGEIATVEGQPTGQGRK